MTYWILILTLYGSPYKPVAAIHSLPGFTSKESCEAAAAEWVKTIDVSADGGYRLKPTALCVAQPPRKP